MEKVVKSEWSEVSMKAVETHLESAAEINFIPRIAYENHRFGDIVITTTAGEKFNVATKIMEFGQAVSSNDFLFGKIYFNLYETLPTRNTYLFIFSHFFF